MKLMPFSALPNKRVITGTIACAFAALLMACSSSQKIEVKNDASPTAHAPELEKVTVTGSAIAKSPSNTVTPNAVSMVSNVAPRQIMPVAPPPAPIVAPEAAPHYRHAVRMLHEVPTNLVVEKDTARYEKFKENSWKLVSEEPVSTFSADVDTGSYANVRRFIQQGRLPNPDAVRAEELVNYFAYDYVLPNKDSQHPFSVHTQVSSSPWNATRQLIRIAIKGKDVAKETLPAANLVFLVDVSGSMSPADRLPLLRTSLKLLVSQLRPQDRVSLVTYANGTRVALPATAGDQKSVINLAIDQLTASGGTNGEAGIKLAYAQAHAAHIPDGINRVLLATDGDLNIGVTNDGELKSLVERERKAGISLSTLGVGDSNYNEALMKKLADNGDGSYHYLDSLQEAHKVLVNEYTSTLATIAQDLKLQVEFNPDLVKEYRLIGYELRALSREQFNDDKVDAGDIGAGHTVTALYEIVPKASKGNIDPLRYQTKKDSAKTRAKDSKTNELAWLKLRYKTPGSQTSQLVETPINQTNLVTNMQTADQDFRFATAVAAWAQWLRGSSLIADFGPKEILALAKSARGDDRFGHRAEFIRLVELSAALQPEKHQQANNSD